MNPDVIEDPAGNYILCAGIGNMAAAQRDLQFQVQALLKRGYYPSGSCAMTEDSQGVYTIVQPMYKPVVFKC